ncbi:MAG TPA: hypothetical protein PLI70_03230 [Gemmatimonadales bacterium]|nr:hypothetical protein [Gemmatimonadales bacterium]
MRQCIQGVALAILVATPAAAQLPAIGAPRGFVRFEIGGDWANTTNQLFNGADQPYRAEFSTPLIGSAFYPELSQTQARIAQLSGIGGYTLSVGGATMVAQASVGTLRLGATIGLTSKLSIFGMVPVVRQQVQVNYGYDSTGANAGYNPADPVFGSAAGADSVNAFLLEYKTALDTLSARIAGGYYVDPDSLALAEATLASGAAYYAGLDSLFVVSGAAGSFVPLASSSAGQAMAGEISNVQTAMAALSISSFTQPLPLPAGALSPSEYNTYLTTPAGSIGATPFATETSFLLGDMEFGASYTIIDRWNRPEQPGGLRVVAQGLVRLPTGYQPLPNDFVSLPTGGGQTDIQASVVADVGGGRFGARLAGSYNDQLSTTADRRVTLPSQPIPWSNRLATVSQDPGDEFTLSALPYFQLVPGFAVVGVLRYWSHGADAVEYASAADAIPGVSASELATDTERSATIVGGGLSWAPSQVGTRTGTKYPVDAFWLYEAVVSGSGGVVPKAGTMRMGFRWPFRFWGSTSE